MSEKAGGKNSKSDWALLPPAARPLAFALSSAVVALVIWNKTAVAPEDPPLHPPGAANVFDMKTAPVAQRDFSDLVSKSSGEGPEAAPSARKEGVQRRARALGSPLQDPSAERGASAMTEEERSAANERMFGGIEAEKKRMGIVKVLPKDALEGARGAAVPAAPKIVAPAPSMLKRASQSMPTTLPYGAERASGDRRPAPDAGLVFSDASGLASSWILLGFPGKPPVVDFASGRLMLLKPSATKILSVTTKPDSIDVLYRALTPEENPDPIRDRVAPIPREPRAVLIFDASPR